jgi:hypothetical protein
LQDFLFGEVIGRGSYSTVGFVLTRKPCKTAHET